jgi:predicted transposase/invertase (TIGR01784 family)
MSKDDRTLISFDWALKTILRQRDNFDILEGFLSDLLNDAIKITGLLESESNKDSEDDKFNRVDLKAQDSKGKEIIIEVQHDPEPDYLERVYYGAAKSLVNDMWEGYKYGKVKKIISVSIVYWGLLKKSYVVKGSMKFEDLVGNQEIKNTKDIFADYYFIQPKLFEDKIKNKLDEWVYLFKHSKIKGDIQATNMDKAQDKLDRLKMTESERKAYEEYQLNKTINEGVLQVKVDEGRQQIINGMRAS